MKLQSLEFIRGNDYFLRSQRATALSMYILSMLNKYSNIIHDCKAISV